MNHITGKFVYSTLNCCDFYRFTCLLFDRGQNHFVIILVFFNALLFFDKTDYNYNVAWREK